jgi:putative DNA topoisomerase
MSKKSEAIFPQHHNQQANKLAYGDCPKCDSPLQLKYVGKSSFLGCTAYPKCDYSHSLNTSEVSTLKLIDNSHCPQCEAQLAVKKGRYGMFIGCTNFPSCHFISTNQQQKIQAEYTPVDCPTCKKGQLQKRQNRFGKFFYACDNYPKCKYILNQEPVVKLCPKCGGNIMLSMAKGEDEFVCAKASCGHRLQEIENNEPS